MQIHCSRRLKLTSFNNRSSRPQNILKKDSGTDDLNKTINKLDLINMLRTSGKMLTFPSNTQIKINYMLGQKESHSLFLCDRTEYVLVHRKQ